MNGHSSSSNPQKNVGTQKLFFEDLSLTSVHLYGQFVIELNSDVTPADNRFFTVDMT